MPRPIRLNAFDMASVGHRSTALWLHPRDRSGRYNTLEYLADLARTLELYGYPGLPESHPAARVRGDHA